MFIQAVIVNWNQSRQTSALIESLKIHSSLHELKIIVVDNASSDNSVKIFSEKFPFVQLLQNSENGGGSGGFAIGMSEALKSKSDFIWLLDADTKIEPETLSELAKALLATPSLAAVGPQIRRESNPEVLQEAGGNFNRWTGQLKFLKSGKKYIAQDQIRLVDQCSSCCLLLRTSAIQKVGVMNSDFFLLYDDLDLCARLRRASYSIACVLSTSARHEFWNDKPITFNRYYYAVRNRHYFFLESLSPGPLVKTACSLGLSLRGWLERLCFSLSGRPDLLIAYQLAIEDYVLQMRGRISKNLPPLKASKSPFPSKRKRILAIGFNHQQEREEIQKFFPSESRLLFQSYQGFWTFFLQLIQVVSFRANIAVVNGQRLDHFSFFTGRTWIFNGSEFYDGANKLERLRSAFNVLVSGLVIPREAFKCLGATSRPISK